MFKLALIFRIVEITDGQWVGFNINHEGIFLFLSPFELAFLWPWVDL